MKVQVVLTIDTQGHEHRKDDLGPVLALDAIDGEITDTMDKTLHHLTRRFPDYKIHYEKAVS